MTRHLLLPLVLLALFAAVARGAIVEIDVEPAGEVWVGQRASLRITVLVPGWFAKAPRFRLPEVPGLLILDTGDRPVNTSRTVDGVSMSGTIHEFAVMARRAGSYTIPGIGVRYAVAGAPGVKSAEERAETAPVTFDAVLPPGAEGLPTLISAAKVVVSQSFDPDTTSGTAGDALARTITFEADDVPGMAFPPVEFGSLEGASVYPDTPQVTDERERGAFRGGRVDRATYVWQREGVFQLPTLVFFWWNTEGERLERIELPGRKVTVAPGAFGPGGAAAGGGEQTGGVRWFGMAAVGVLLLAGGAVAVLVTRARRRDPELTRFRELVRACRADDPLLADRALRSWLQTVFPGEESPTMGDLVRSGRDSGLAAASHSLQEALLGARAGWSGGALLALLPRLRARLVRRSRHPGGDWLPPLNPPGRA